MDEDRRTLAAVKAKDENPLQSRAENGSPSETSLEHTGSAATNNKKPSVLQRLREITEQQKAARAAAEKGEQVVEAVKDIAAKGTER